jgi:broad specificity phosphatase PhoE
MHLAICRHGETVENKTGIIQGWIPGSLTDEGEEQARLLAKEIKEFNPDYIFVSDLGRCMDTLGIITAEGIQTTKRNTFVDWRLRERAFGSLEGKSSEGVDWLDFFANDPTVSKYGEETNENLYLRIIDFLNSLKNLFKESDAKVLVITHGGVVNAIKALEYGDNYTAKKYPNATLIDVDFNAVESNIQNGIKGVVSAHN